MKKIKIIVEEITTSEWEIFRTIRLNALLQYPVSFGGGYDKELKYKKTHWTEILSSSSQKFYGIKINNQFVSIAGVKQITSYEWMMISVFTEKEYQKNEFSTKIIKHIIHEVETYKNSTLFLYVNAELKNTIQFYKKLGFKIISQKTEKDIDMGGNPDCKLYFMEKQQSCKT